MKNPNTKTTAKPAEKPAAVELSPLEKAKATIAKLEAQANATLAKGNRMTEGERLQLLFMLNIAYHSGGSKIAGCFSIDGTSHCDFCQNMIHSAICNPLMICGFCYAFAESQWKYAANHRHQLNARVLSTVLFSESELSSIPIPGALCRINEDGDIVNETHARNIIRIIKTHPNTDFGFWYKNRPAIESGLNAEGIYTREDIPANAHFVHFSVLIGFPAMPTWFDDKIFTVYPSEEVTLDAVKKGAMECNGRKCATCGYHCYTDPHTEKPVYVAETLRTNKAKRAEILAAYNAKVNG